MTEQEMTKLISTLVVKTGCVADDHPFAVNGGRDDVINLLQSLQKCPAAKKILCEHMIP